MLERREIRWPYPLPDQEGDTMPKKPDRFERMVKRITKSDEDVGYQEICFPDEVLKLLRAEHAWMRRVVRAIQRSRIAHMDEWIVLRSVLYKLSQRRK